MTLLTLDQTRLAGTTGAIAVKVELGFTEAGFGAPFFTLDDPVKGVLNNEIYVLGGGEAFVDVTSNVRRILFNRGKSRELDKYNAGRAVVQFNNNDRTFDPTYEASPYYGQIVPQRTVRITINSEVVYTGIVDDWNIDYSLDKLSVAELTAFDSFSQLANAEIIDFAPDEELSGARVNAVLDNIGWAASARSIDTGSQLLEAQIISTGVGALPYLQTVSQSESGEIFINKLGEVEFVDSLNNQTVTDVVFTDVTEGTGIRYDNIKIVYGSEQLHNEITATAAIGTAVATNDNSVEAYGLRSFALNTFVATEEDLQSLADYLAQKYSRPEFRIQSLSVNMDKLFQEERNKLLELELGDSVIINFTPNDIPPQISRVGKIIGIGYNATPDRQDIEFQFQTIQLPVFILDSLLFGKLDENVLGF